MKLIQTSMQCFGFFLVVWINRDTKVSPCCSIISIKLLSHCICSNWTIADHKSWLTTCNASTYEWLQTQPLALIVITFSLNPLLFGCQCVLYLPLERIYTCLPQFWNSYIWTHSGLMYSLSRVLLKSYRVMCFFLFILVRAKVQSLSIHQWVLWTCFIYSKRGIYIKNRLSRNCQGEVATQYIYCYSNLQWHTHLQ